MGDLGPELSPEEVLAPLSAADLIETNEEIHVLVTGFGPFKINPLNPSFLIASSLPKTIPAPPSSSATPRNIRIHTHPSPIRVSYSAVRITLPAIIDSFKREHNGQSPDFIIHIGMASTRHFYSVETHAHRDGYRLTDVDGELGYDDGEAVWKQEGLPEILQPGPASTNIACFSSSIIPAAAKSQMRIRPSPLDVAFLEKWRCFGPEKVDLRLSEDAGRYLCEFIYYASLAQAYKEERARSVVFFHVPGWTDQGSIEKGKDVAIGLIKTLVSYWVDESAN